MRVDDMTVGRSPTSPPMLSKTIEAVPLDDDRRIEDWIVGTLDGRSQGRTTPRPTLPRPATPSAASSWLSLARRTFQQQAEPVQESNPDPKSKSLEPWARFRLVEGESCTILRLNDHALLKEDDIRDLANELVELVGAGHRRLVLNFGDVHRLSSRACAMLLKVHRRCVEEGGLLKICGLRRELAEAISITGLEREFGVHPDEASAVAAAWPSPVLRALPIAELLDLGARGTCALRASDPATHDHESAEATGGDQGGPARFASRVRLVVKTGKLQGRIIPVMGARFAIGRDPHCQLRPESLKISRMHTLIERRDRRVFVRDLGSSNGTILNGRRLRDESAEVFNGDQLQVGPVQLAIEVGGTLSPEARVAEIQVAKWLFEASSGVDSNTKTLIEMPTLTEADPTPAVDDPTEGEATEDGPVRHQVLQDVLVVTIRTPSLEPEEEIDSIRAELMALFHRPLPRRIVIDLDVVARLSSAAVGMLVAHLLRVERAGGSIRLCQVQPGVRSVLERIGMPSLMESYLTIDDGVLASWR